MKHIFTLCMALALIVSASQQGTTAGPKGGGTKTRQASSQPKVSPNPAYDYLKIYWTQDQCDNVTIELYYANGMLASTFTNQQYCDGIYTEYYKVSGFIRGNYVLKIRIGAQKWSYKILLQ